MVISTRRAWYNITMKIISLVQTPEDDVIKQAQAVLAAGGLIIFPTETVYGAGVDATNQAAVHRLLSYKSRREGKPLSIAVTDLAMAEDFVELNDQARDLYKRFLPGPLTIISKSKGTVAPGVASEFGTLGTRIPAYPLVLNLVQAYGKPITATSANASDKKKPYTIKDILNNLSEKQKSLIGLIIDAGELPKNPPSTVIDTTLSAPITLRRGEVLSSNEQAAINIVTHSEQETRSLAGRLLLKHWNELHKHGLLITLDGALGTGKTIFAKGVAEFLGITETITSPTYTYIEEYPYTRHQTTGMMYHLDLWKVDSKEMYDRLEIEQLIKPNNVVIIEWFSQVADFWKINSMKTNVDVKKPITNPTQIQVYIDESSHKERYISVTVR